MNIGDRIKSKRKEKRLTQKELSDLVNVSAQVISNWERDYTHPDYDDVARLSEVLNCSSDYLLGRTDKKESGVSYTAPLTKKDEQDIAKRLEQIKSDIEHTDGLAFDGEPLSKEAQESFLEAMEYVVRTTKKINKKYTPKKYRKENKDE